MMMMSKKSRSPRCFYMLQHSCLAEQQSPWPLKHDGHSKTNVTGFVMHVAGVCSFDHVVFGAA